MQTPFISPNDKLLIANMINDTTFKKFMSRITYDIETEILVSFNEKTLSADDHINLHNLNRALISLNNRVDLMGGYTEEDLIAELQDGGEQ